MFNIIFYLSLVLIAHAIESEIKVNELSSQLSSTSQSLLLRNQENIDVIVKATHAPDDRLSSMATHPPYPFKKDDTPLKSFPSTSLTQSLRNWFRDRLSFLTSSTLFIPLTNKASINKQTTVDGAAATSSTSGEAASVSPVNNQNFWTRFLQSLRRTLIRRNEQLQPKPKLSSNIFTLINKLKQTKLIKQNEHLARS